MGPGSFEARVELCLGRYSRALASALAVEARQAAPYKGEVAVAERGGCVEVMVRSSSLSGLSALLNSYLLLAHAAYSAARIADAG